MFWTPQLFNLIFHLELTHLKPQVLSRAIDLISNLTTIEITFLHNILLYFKTPLTFDLYQEELLDYCSPFPVFLLDLCYFPSSFDFGDFKWALESSGVLTMHGNVIGMKCIIMIVGLLAPKNSKLNPSVVLSTASLCTPHFR